MLNGLWWQIVLAGLAFFVTGLAFANPVNMLKYALQNSFKIHNIGYFCNYRIASINREHLVLHQSPTVPKPVQTNLCRYLTGTNSR